MNPILIYICSFLTLLIASCGNKGNERNDRQQSFNRRDTADIINVAISFRDTLITNSNYHSASLGCLMQAYPLDTVWFIKNDILQESLPLTFPGKVIEFINPPNGYPKGRYIPINIDLQLTGLTIQEDSASCVIYSKVFSGFFEYELANVDGAWQVKSYSNGKE